jgi:hypothetical protein
MADWWQRISKDTDCDIPSNCSICAGVLGSYDAKGPVSAEAFLQVRSAYTLGSASRYCPNMLAYHYHNDLAQLERFVTEPQSSNTEQQQQHSSNNSTAAVMPQPAVD